MTEQELRSHYDLKPCPNAPHSFELGRLMGEWVWAEDSWSQLVGDKLQTHYCAFTSSKNVHNTVIYSFVIWKLKVIWVG